MQSRFGSRPQQPYELTAPLEGEVEEGEIEDPGNQILFPDAGNSGEGDEQEEEEYEMSLGEPVALEEAEEGRMAKPIRSPILPSPEEIEAHKVSHIPFRSWCSHCVRGRGKSYSHHRVTRASDPEEVPVVSIDYGFFGSPGELPADAVGGQKMPVLIMRDRQSKTLQTFLVPSKGVEHFYPEQALCRGIKLLGYPSLVLKSDQEPAIKAVAEAVKNAFATSGVRVQLENSPKGDHHGKSNGEAEAAVEITQGLCRTFKDACETGMGVQIDPRSPMLAWLIEHAGNMYTLYAHDESMKDGLTPYRRLKGRDWQVALPPWGEAVDYRVRTKHKLEARWATGIFCGVRLNTTEKIIATENGIVVAQSVRRKPEELRWNSELFGHVKGTPWAPIPGRSARPEEAEALEEAISVEPELPDEPAEAPVPAEKSEAPRRVYIRSSDLEKHGYSALCPACALIRMGLPRQGIAHSEDCRERMVRKLTETEEGRKRVEAAKRKDPPLKFQKVERPEEPQVRDPSAVSAPGPSGGASSSAKRSSEVPSIQEARPAKRVHEVGSKKAKVAVEEPSTVSVPAPPAPSAPSAPAAGDVEMADEGTTRAAQPKRPRESEEEMATNLLLSLRTGFLNAVYQAHEQYPVCEERLGTEQIEEYEASYWDDVSGKPLRPELVEVARKEEIATITEMGVWEVIPRPYNEPVISTRWVDVNKRDEKSPKYRSRLVARELKKRSRNGGADGPYTPSWEDFYASMPPISALRTLFALATTRRAPDLNGRMQEMPLDQCLVFLDIKKAHFWADARRRLLVELPKEAGIDVRKYVGLLRKSLYGTRDAPANWEATILKVMTLLGFVQGRSNSCLYYHSTRGIRVEVHGDDFTGLGAKDQLEWFAQELGKHWTVEVRGYLGPPGMAGTKQNIDILNRLVSWTNRGIELEGDPRHAEIIIREMGCSGGKITTPLVKERVEEVDSADPLSSDDASKYRSVSMRLAYLSQDRPDLQVLAKELAKGLKSPTTAHMQMLKRGARYLQNRPRMIHLFPHQRSISRLDIWTDSDHAGCLRTRKSTSGYCVRLGGSTTKTSCKSQAVIALSSGEAEFYSLVSAACGGLGEQSALRDWGIWLPIQCWMDSNTGLAIASRHGLGRVKHVDTIFMWVQDAVSSGRIALGKKPTLDMLADLLTKALDQARMRMLLERMNYHFRDGRHSLALDV